MKAVWIILVSLFYLCLTYQIALAQEQRQIINTEISPNLAWVVVTDNMGRIDLYNANGQFVYRFRDSGVGVLGISWKSDSLYFVTGDHGGLVQIWDVQTRLAILSFPDTLQGIVSLRWNTLDSKIVAISPSQGKMGVWDSNTGQLLTIQSTGDSNDVAWQLPQNTILSVGPQGLSLRDTLGNRLQLMENVHYPYLIEVNPVNSNIIGLTAINGYDNFLLMYALENKTILSEITLINKGVSKLAWSPDGTKIAISIQNDSINIWEYPSGLLLKTLPISATIIPFYWQDNQTIQYYDNSMGSFSSVTVSSPTPTFTPTPTSTFTPTSSPTDTPTATNTPKP